MTTAPNRLKLPNYAIVKDWNSKQILSWLRKFQLDDCIPAFENREIDGPALLELTEEKLFTFQDIKIKRRGQLAKCVNECKSQATQAKKLVKNIKIATKKEEPTVDDTQDESDFDYWDTDYDDDDENDEDNQSLNKTNHQVDTSNMKTLPVLENDNSKTSSGLDEMLTCKPSISEKFSDTEQYADHLQNINTTLPLATTATSLKTTLSTTSQVPSSSPAKAIPKPPSTKVAIKNYPRVNIPRSLPIKRPPSQPPPPPIPQPLSPESLQGDYEIPINPLSLVQPVAISSASPFQSSDINNTILRKLSNASMTSGPKTEETNQETYEIVEPPEENYEVVNECKWSGSGLSVHCDTKNRPAIPPRIIGSQPSFPPPLPEKPKKLQESLAPLTISSNKDKIGSSERPRLPKKSIDESSQNDKIGSSERPLLPKKSIDESSQNGISTTTSNNILTNILGGFKDSKRVLAASLPKVLDQSPVVDTDNQVSRASTPEKNAGDSSTSSSPRNSSSTLDVRKGSPAVSRTSPQPTDDGGTNVANRPLPPVPIQALNGYSWFHNIEREVAEEQVLNLSEDGAYVVRPSKRAGQTNPFTLTVSHCGRIFHLNIRHRPDGMFSLGREKPREKAFDSVVDLITFHQKEPILLTLRGETIGKTILDSTIEK